MNHADLIRLYKTATAAARALGYSKQRVSVWKARGAIPLGTQFEINHKTRGRLKVTPPKTGARRRRPA